MKMPEKQQELRQKSRELLKDIEKHASQGATELYCSKATLTEILGILSAPLGPNMGNILSEEDKPMAVGGEKGWHRCIYDETEEIEGREYKYKIETAFNKYRSRICNIKVFYDSKLEPGKYRFE